MNQPLLTVEGLRVGFQKAEGGYVEAVRGVDLTVSPGEAVGVYPMVADYDSVDRYRRFAADLQKRGWSQARLEKLMGGNFLRVYRDAWGA